MADIVKQALRYVDMNGYARLEQPIKAEGQSQAVIDIRKDGPAYYIKYSSNLEEEKNDSFWLEVEWEEMAERLRHVVDMW